MAKQQVIVSVLADTKKFSRAFKNLSKEVGLTRLGQGFKNLGSKVVGFLKTGIKWTAGLATGIAALALKGGFERALNIEDAQAQLRGIGHDAKSVDKIMESALASVKGTAFGLGDAATIAATAVAAGVKPGEKLTRTLKLTANTAALAKTGLNEMGSILNKVWTRGRVSTREMNQIADRGIPIWTKLAEKYGVNQAQLEKMVSAGKVSAADFADALENTVGTAADEMGKTTRGSWANMLAAFSRGGERFLKGIFPMFTEGMGGITDFADQLADRVEPIGKAFAQWITGTAVPAVKSLGKWLSGTLFPALKEVWEVVSGAFSDAWRTISEAFADAGGSAGKTGKALSGGLVKALRTTGTILGTLIRGIGSFVAWAIRWRNVLLPIVLVVTSIVVAVKVFTKALLIAKAAVAAWVVVTKVWTAATTAMVAVKKLAAAAQWAWNAALTANPIGLIIAAIAALVAGLTYFFTQTETGKKAWAAFTKFLRTAWDAVVKFFKTAVDKVVAFFRGLWDWVKTVFSWHPLAIVVRNWDKIVAFFRRVGENVVAFFGKAWDFIKQVWSYTPIGLITTNWNKIISWVRDIPNRIRTIFSNARQWLVNAGKNIINGLWDGLKNAWSNVTGWFSGLGDWIARNKGPKSYDLRILRPAGRWIIEGLQKGLSASLPALRRTLGTVTRTVSGTEFPTQLRVQNPAGPTRGRAGGNTYKITVQTLSTGPEAARAVVDAIREYERFNGPVPR